MFTVVSEPSSVDDGDCLDVAFAVVNLLQVRIRKLFVSCKTAV